MTKTCIACGGPMKKLQDYPLKDTTKNYCAECANPDGSMFSYQQQVVALTEFFMETQGLEKSKAKEAALAMMANLPAWKNKK